VQATPPGHLARAEVDHVLVTQGPGVIIRRILYEEVVNGGKFIGWRMVGLPEEWRDIDLRPGDIVTRVNGLPIERPEQAWEAWKSLATSPDLRITLTRDGGARTLVLPIDGAPVPDTLTALGREPGPSRPAAEEGRGQPARTVIDSEQEAY
jgi:hypothetical protein